MINFWGRHKVLVIFLAVIVVVFISGILALITSRGSNLQPAPTQETQAVDYFQTVVGQTTDEEVKSLPNAKDVQEVNGGTEYSYNSINAISDDAIVTREGVVVFEKRITIDPSYVHPALSVYLNELGTPEEVLVGSKIYGPNVNYYLYPSLGITVIGRPFSDEVEEVQQYVPMSKDEYIETWGENILGEDNITEEGL